MQNFSTLFYPSSVALVNAKDIASNITVNIVNGAEITDLSAKALDAYDIALTYQSVSSTYLTAIPANLSLTSVNATVILSGGVDLKNIFLTSETDSQTLTYISSSYNLSISNGNNVNLSSIVVSPNTDTIFRTVSAIALSGVFYGDGSNLIGASLPGQAQINTTVQTNSAGWNTAYNTATIYSTTSGSFATNTTVNNISSILTPLILTNTLTGQLVTNTDFTNYQTSVAGSTATLLPTSIYQNASGNWQNAYTNLVTNSAAYLTGVDLTFLQQPSANWNSTYTAFSNNSANYVLQGGNSVSVPLSVGTSSNQPLILETNNTNRVTILSSGQVGIGTINPNSALTVVGDISASGSVTTLALSTTDIFHGTKLSFNVNGAERMRIYNNGNVAYDDFGNLPGAAGNSNYKVMHYASPVGGGSTMLSMASRGTHTIFFGNLAGSGFVIGSEGTTRGINFKTGLTYSDSNTLNTGNSLLFLSTGGGLSVRSNDTFNWSNNASNANTGTIDLLLSRDAAGVLALRNGFSPQTYRLYNSYTDATNYQRSTLTHANSSLVIGTEYITTAGNSALSGQAMPIILAPGYNQSLSATAPVVLQQTWNNANNTFTLLSANVTDNASNSNSRLLDLQVNGASRFTVGKGGSITIGNVSLVDQSLTGQLSIGNYYFQGTFFNAPAANAIGWGTSLGVQDTRIWRDGAANIVALRNDLNPQTFRIYNTYTAGTPVSSEFGYMQWSGNTFQIGTSSTGSGSNRNIEFQTAGSTRMTITSAGDIVATGDITANRIQATVKNFYIDHPTKPGKHLVYSSLEAPYNGVQLTGEGELVSGQCVVELPDYISSLIRSNNIHIQLTNYKHSKTLYVDSIEIEKNRFTVKCDSWTSKFKTLKFFWLLNGVRKDIEELKVEV